MSPHRSLTALFAIAVCLVSGCASIGMQSPLASFEHSQVYFPVAFPEGNWQPDGLTFENAWFTAADGTQLHGWYVPHPNPRAVALFAHGNAGNVSHRADSLKILHDRHQLAVLAFDYRGYGKSEGTPSEVGLLQDARAARAWLAQKTAVAESDIVLFGRSLGGGVMADLAAKDGARGLVLASTFTSLPDVGRHHMPLVPAGLLMKNRFNSIAKIGDYQGPLLQSHGDADRVIPFEFGTRLFAAANEPKRFITLPGGGHNSPQSDEYRDALDEFIDSLPRADSK